LKSRSAAVLCYPSSRAREALGSETARFHHASGRRGGVAARAVRAQQATMPVIDALHAAPRADTTHLMAA